MNWHVTRQLPTTKALIEFDYVTMVNECFVRDHVPSVFSFLGMRTKVLLRLFIYFRAMETYRDAARTQPERATQQNNYSKFQQHQNSIVGAFGAHSLIHSTFYHTLRGLPTLENNSPMEASAAAAPQPTFIFLVF